MGDPACELPIRGTCEQQNRRAVYLDRGPKVSVVFKLGKRYFPRRRISEAHRLGAGTAKPGSAECAVCAKTRADFAH